MNKYIQILSEEDFIDMCDSKFEDDIPLMGATIFARNKKDNSVRMAIAFNDDYYYVINTTHKLYKDNFFEHYTISSVKPKSKVICKANYHFTLELHLQDFL